MAFALSLLNDVFHPSPSPDDLRILILSILMSSAISLVVYFAAKELARLDAWRKSAATLAIASPIVLTEGLLGVWWWKTVIGTSVSLGAVIFVLGLLLVIGLTVLLIHRLAKKISALHFLGGVTLLVVLRGR